jgi:hypothetical protein
MARSESRSAPAPHDPDCVLARCARFGRCEILISPKRLGAKPLSGHFGTGQLLLLVRRVPATIAKTEATVKRAVVQRGGSRCTRGSVRMP